MKRAHIISVGNELLIGDTVNTNASWIGRFLTEQGFSIDEVITISDNYSAIRRTIEWSLSHADLVISTGGLGPTHDDVTKKAVADLFNSEMVLDEQVLDHIKKMFRRRGFEFSRSNKDQAMVPDACEVLFNKSGTAPGLWFEKNGSCLAVLPGVPYEMQYLMEEKVAEKISSVFPQTRFRKVSYLKTAGVTESSLSDDIIGDLGRFLTNGIEVAYLPGPGGVTLRLSVQGESPESSGNRLQELEDHIMKKAGDYVFGKGRDLTLAEALGSELRKRSLSISTAESCTGGHLSNDITDIPGCSDYFKGSVVAYSNDVKISRLGVPASVIENHGAVSRETALAMADGVARSLNSEIGISTTGIAGPGGGTEHKPVGTVWMGFRILDQHFALKALLTKNRNINKQRSSMIALETVRRTLLKVDDMPYGIKKETA